MTTKHTPGPWKVCQDPTQEHGRVIKAADLDHVAYLPRWSNFQPEMNANARLIAAAPDLAEAAMPIAAIAERLPEWAMDENMVHVSARDIRALAAAIAKAEGRS